MDPVVLLIAVVALVGLALAAQRWGYDSRGEGAAEPWRRDWW